MNEIKFEKIYILIKRNWMAVLVAGFALLILIITLLIPSDKKTTVRGSNPQPTNKPFNPFGIFGKNEQKKEEVVDTEEAISKSLQFIHSGNPQAAVPTGIIKILPNGTQSTQPIGESETLQTSQGTINTQSNIQTGVNSNDQLDYIRIIFQNPDGSTTTYIPPGTPPNEVRWGRYTNTRYKYAINYPVNWHFFYTIDQDGHEGIALYPPYISASEPNRPYIGFGLTERFLLPAAGDTSNALITPIRADGINGNLYTEGPLGSSYIASTFQYNEKYFGLGASMSDETFAYVYYYMLYSLTFNIE